MRMFTCAYFLHSSECQFECTCPCACVSACYVKVASQPSPCGAPSLLSSPHNLTKTLISPPMMDAYGFLRH